MPETVYNDGSYLTQKGNNLIAKLIASGEGLQFTRVSVGDGSLPLGTSPDSMTSLGHEVMNGSIASITNSNNGEVSIVAQVSSIGVETGFSVTELGLWATDPDEGEILYTYLSLQEHPEWIRPDGESVNKFAVFTLVIIVAGIQIVSATISQNAFATLEDLKGYASLDLLSSYEGASMIGNEAIGDIQEGTISEQLVTILGRINDFSTLFSSKTHSHGSITNDGKIGTDANKAVYTGEDGTLQAGALPVAAGGTGATTAEAARAGIDAAPSTHSHGDITSDGKYAVPISGEATILWCDTDGSIFPRANVETLNALGAQAKVSRLTPAGGTAALTLADNTEYRFSSSVTSLTLTYPSGNFDSWIQFTTGDSITVTFPLSTTFIGKTPNFEASKTYEMSIKDGCVICSEVTSE